MTWDRSQNASILADRRSSTWRPVELLVLAAVVVAGGALVAISPSPKIPIGMALLVFGVGVARRHFTTLAVVAIIVCVGFPIVSANGVVAFSFAVAGRAIPAQLAAIYLVTLLAVLNIAWGDSRIALHRLSRGYSSSFVLWALVVAVFGAASLGTPRVALGQKDALFYAVPIMILVPFALARPSPARVSRLVLLALFVAVTLCALTAVAIFAIPGLKATVSSGTMYEGTGRVALGATALLSLGLPLALLLMSNRQLAGWRFVAVLLSVFAMAGAELASQSRTLILATGFNCALVLLSPGFRQVGGRRRRVWGVIMLSGLMAALILVVGTSLGVGSITSTSHNLAARMSRLKTASKDTAFVARVLADEAALTRWRATPKTFVVGEGLGSTFGLYAAGNYIEPYGQAPKADNSWVTLAVQGGLVMLAAFGATVVASFLAFVRASRRAGTSFERLVWRAVAVSFPAFIVEATMLSAHYLTVPGVFVGIACLVAAADFACERRQSNSEQARVGCACAPLAAPHSASPAE